MHVPGAAPAPRSGARGVARIAGPRTPAQSAPRGAAAHRSVGTPAHPRQTSAASTRPTDTRQPAMAVRSSRPRLPGLLPREHRLHLRSPGRSPPATGHAARARRSTESGSPAAAVSRRPAVPEAPADRSAGASCRPPSGAGASARSRRHWSGAAAPAPGAAAAIRVAAVLRRSCGRN